MAEDNTAPKEAAANIAEAASGPKPLLFYILILVNILFILGIGALVYLGKKKQAAQPSLQTVINGEAKTHKESLSDSNFIGTLVPMETFLVNLAGSRGTRLLKVNMEFEVTGKKVQEEIEQRKPQLRDIIIILLSSKTYEQVSTAKGKEELRDEIRDTVNSFLTQGRIKRVLFTDFIYS